MNSQSRIGSLDAFLIFIREPKKAVKEWADDPPRSLSVIVLLLVCLELVLNRRLARDMGTGPSALHQFVGFLLFILICQGLFISIAHKIGRLFYKKGSPGHVWTFCNLSLWPLLMILPIGVVIWTSGLSPAINFLVMILLAGKIFTDWKIIIDRHYQFNRWQSALVLLAMGGIVYTILPIILLFNFLGTVGEFVSMLR